MNHAADIEGSFGLILGCFCGVTRSSRKGIASEESGPYLGIPLHLLRPRTIHQDPYEPSWKSVLKMIIADTAPPLTTHFETREALLQLQTAMAGRKEYDEEAWDVLNKALACFTGYAEGSTRNYGTARTELLSVYRCAHSALHRMWTAMVGEEGYDKKAWMRLDNALSHLGREASEKCGIAR